MKIGIHTSAIGVHVSGGILAIVEVLNRLKQLGHEVFCFVDEKDTSSQWLTSNFPILHSDSGEYRNFDGVLVSPFSPTAKAVNDHKNASHKFYWVHSNEAMFTHNGKEWTSQAQRSYTLPNLKIFCVSTYLQILLEHLYGVKSLGTIVSPGIDTDLFQQTPQNPRLRIGFLNRPEHVRGTDVAVLGMALARQKIPDIQLVQIPVTRHRHEIAAGFGELDVYVDCSRLAGSPTPVKESMSCGCIPISTYYGANDFILDRWNGFIIPPDNPQAVCDCVCQINELSLKERQEIGDFNAKYIRKKYNWDRVTKDFLLALREGGVSED